MAFDDRDQVVQSTVSEVDSTERIEFIRDRSLPGVQMRVVVTQQAMVGGGVTRKITKTVPRAVVDASWPGGQKTLKAWMLAIIDAAV